MLRTEIEGVGRSYLRVGVGIGREGEGGSGDNGLLLVVLLVRSSLVLVSEPCLTRGRSCGSFKLVDPARHPKQPLPWNPSLHIGGHGGPRHMIHLDFCPKGIRVRIVDFLYNGVCSDS